MISTAVNIEKEFNQSYDLERNAVITFAGFKLTQSVKIQSLDMNRLETISREVTELIEKGIEFNSTEPLYFYTKTGH
jgi:hypothetical protein